MSYSALLLLFILPVTSQLGEKLLLDHLVNKTSTFVRPVVNRSTSVVATFGFELVHIVAIVESEQVMAIKVWMRMSWINELMIWDPKAWDNVTSSRLNFKYVWTPDIYLHEDIAEDMSSGPEKYKTPITIQSNGKHTWFVPTLYRSSCNFDVTNFPFDRQICTLIFTSWTHDQTEIDIKADPRPVITSSYINSSEWELLDVTREVQSTFYGCCPNPFVDIRFTVRLRRKPLYYIYNVVVPCIIQMFVILFTFFLPPDSGERIGVVITVLLVFAVYLKVLSGSLPKTSTTTPILSRFYIAAMVGSALSIVATSMVLVIHFKGTEKGIQAMPRWVRTSFLDCVAKFVYVKSNRRQHGNEDIVVATPQRYTKIPVQDNDVGKDIKIENEINENEVAMRDLIHEVSVITSLIHDLNRQDEIEEEWQMLAKVLDRIFFLIFLTIFLVSSFVILAPVQRLNMHDGHKYH